MGREPRVKLVRIKAHEPTDLGVGHSPLVAEPADEAKADVEPLRGLFRLEHGPFPDAT
jgi:hypothetical protein